MKKSNGNVFGAGPELGILGNFEARCIVFEDFALDRRLGKRNGDIVVSQLVE